MAKESTLTKIQRESIAIEKFVFHIIIFEDDTPIFLDQVELTESQKTFFKDRISEVAEGTQYTFNDKEHNTLIKLCKDLYVNDEFFIDSSKTICTEFKSHHGKNMTDGAFIIATLNMLDTDDLMIPLIALLKMDQKKVLEYELETTELGKKAKMREIADSFIESKEAVQKVAIIDIGDTFAWDILAKERKKTDGIAEYFRKFLHAQIRDTSSRLTVKTFDAVSKWARLNTSSLLEISELKTTDYQSYYKKRALDYMKSNESASLNFNNFIDHLFSLENLSDTSKDKTRNLKEKMTEHLIKVGVYGQVFTPKPNSIPKTKTRTKKRTQEGVTIEWNGSAEDKGVKIEKVSNKRTKITITTDNLEDMEK